MQWTDIKSTALTAIGYDAAARLLRIQFKDGSTYQYHDVPPHVYATLMEADSKGGHFNIAIRPRYPYRAL